MVDNIRHGIAVMCKRSDFFQPTYFQAFGLGWIDNKNYYRIAALLNIIITTVVCKAAIFELSEVLLRVLLKGDNPRSLSMVFFIQFVVFLYILMHISNPGKWNRYVTLRYVNAQIHEKNKTKKKQDFIYCWIICEY